MPVRGLPWDDRITLRLGGFNIEPDLDGLTFCIAAQHSLVTEGLRYVRLLLGFSKGGMNAWIWGVKLEFMSALVPMASQSTEMSSRNWMMRRLIIDKIFQHSPSTPCRIIRTRLNTQVEPRAYPLHHSGPEGLPPPLRAPDR